MCSLAIVHVAGSAGAHEWSMRQMEPASDCSDGSSRVRQERRPDVVQVLEVDTDRDGDGDGDLIEKMSSAKRMRVWCVDGHSRAHWPQSGSRAARRMQWQQRSCDHRKPTSGLVRDVGGLAMFLAMPNSL